MATSVGARRRHSTKPSKNTFSGVRSSFSRAADDGARPSFLSPLIKGAILSE
jgi:hypothetical protein